MEETLRQLGDLLLGSIPTVLLFFVLFAAYRILVHKPLARVLQERRSQTEGAIEKARADIAAAEARTAEYENALRDARLQIYRVQETRRQKAMQARAAAIAEARLKADAQIKQAKAALAEDVARSKDTIQAEAERLASEIISTVLRQVGVAQYPVGGAK
jgi:F-type H+-transporting ATPase subunit b